MGNALVTGLDIGRHSIKAVVIKPSKDAFALVSYRTLPIEAGIFSDNHGLNYQKIVKKLKELRKSLPLFNRKVAFAISDNAVITKVLQIDSRFRGYERDLAIEQTFLSQSALDAEPLCFDFVPLGTQSENGKRTYRVFATKQAPLLQWQTTIRQAGLTPIGADVCGYALNHCLQQIQATDSDKPRLLIDLNWNGCSLVFADQQQTLYANSWPQDIKHLGLTPLCQQLQTLLQRLMVQHNQQIEVMWLCGELANCRSSVEQLQQLLQLKIETLNPLSLFTDYRVTEISNSYALASSVAVRACLYRQSMAGGRACLN
ncbi:type IV pilus biogenesis protein PilM [Vibrio sinaloensis]|uniref:type IV pilus biogenesis protein PilM n=1 Tax=Photobacterium sp. (strain ATCC 43367) TaxID=379097 RepID=UPI0020636BEE|nr:pilus assembly protein PilM [Vibrio sinaloensis]UPQ88179.1 pilus assembly protein PilM [Vibrio sinaloensis]